MNVRPFGDKTAKRRTFANSGQSSVTKTLPYPIGKNDKNGNEWATPELKPSAKIVGLRDNGKKEGIKNYCCPINPDSALETHMIVTILLTNNNLYIFLTLRIRDFLEKLSTKFLFYNELKDFLNLIFYQKCASHVSKTKSCLSAADRSRSCSLDLF